MSDISQLKHEHLPATSTLIKATGFAMLIAGVILTTTVLPAEYGIDPTGAGRLLGLTALKSPAPPATVSTSLLASDASPVWKSATPYRSDEMVVILKPGEGTEVKAKMKAGEQFVFSWATEGGVVNVDMHGEPLNAKNDEFTSYWVAKGQVAGHGAFAAPVDGTHGWYWRNRGEQAVTIRVKVSGFYDKLYRPN